MTTSLIFMAFVALAILIFIAKAVRVVPQQTTFVVERLGRFHMTLSAGLAIIIPFIDRVAYRHSLKEVPMDVEPQVCITRDNTQVQIDGVLYYQVTDPHKASYGSSDYVSAIENMAKTTLRSAVGRLELDKLLEERQAINTTVVDSLDLASASWGVKVLRYEIKDIQPPEAVLSAMQMQITAEREKRAKIAESEGERQKEINLAEGAKAAAIARSEGEKQAVINAATAEADAIRLVASATAEGIEKVAAATRKEGGMDAVNLKVAEKYVEAFAGVAKAGNTLILPGDLSNIGGMVASAMTVMKKTS